MPSILIGQPPASGAQLVVSGSVWSGRNLTQGLQLKWVCTASGANVYIALSGGGPPLSGGFMTINSGNLITAGGCLSGMLDGMPLAPGDKYYIEPSVLSNLQSTQSGIFNVWALADQAASGIGRLYFEPFLGFRG